MSERGWKLTAPTKLNDFLKDELTTRRFDCVMPDRMKIKEYKTVGGSNAEDLDAKVNKLLAEGYQLYGNPYLSDSVIDGVESFAIFQALVIES
jgi:hypothetical protein